MSPGGNLQVQYNDILTDLDPLATVDSVGAELHINGNKALTDVDGLLGLSHVGSFVLFGYNFKLPTCEAVAVVDHLQDQGFSGDHCIKSNKSDDCPSETDGCGHW